MTQRINASNKYLYFEKLFVLNIDYLRSHVFIKMCLQHLLLSLFVLNIIVKILFFPLHGHILSEDIIFTYQKDLFWSEIS